MKKAIRTHKFAQEEVIHSLLKYGLINESGKTQESSQKQDKLEEIVEKYAVSKKQVIIEEKIEFLRRIILQIQEEKPKEDFSVNFKKQTEHKKGYSINILYQENESEQYTEVTIVDGKKSYKVAARREKSEKEKKQYQLRILYGINDAEEQLALDYNLRKYPLEREEALQDFTNRVDKSLHIFPKSMMGSILGFTYLGENFMARRDDLVGDKARMVDVHEAIHTPDEYETRVLTDWMLTREKMKYKR